MRFLAPFFATVLMLAGCSGVSIPETSAPSSIGDFTSGYLLEPGNKVRVIVFNEPNLSGEFQIDSSGNLSMPLIGTVPASSATAKILAGRIEETLTKSNYMRTPKVAVEVLSYRPFYVLGEVKLPGEYSYSVGMTVLSAVARAGGYDYRAREGVAVLVRVVDGTEKQYKAVENTPILPGDIIRVTERHF